MNLMFAALNNPLSATKDTFPTLYLFFIFSTDSANVLPSYVDPGYSSYPKGRPSLLTNIASKTWP